MPKSLNWTLIHINNVQKKGAIFIVNYEVWITATKNFCCSGGSHCRVVSEIAIFSAIYQIE
jgi:hypothetical protein